MAKVNWKKTWYMLGIGFGIMFITAFIFSQFVFPIILGRPSVVETPDVVGLGLVQAKRLMQDEKLHVVVRDSLFSESAKLDQVLEQHPSAGTRIKEDGTVQLVISKGSKLVKVPDLIGSTFQEALITLRNYELRGSIVDSLYSDTHPRNTVIRSMPMGGSKIEKKSSVRLVLSRGAEASTDSTDLDIYESDSLY